MFKTSKKVEADTRTIDSYYEEGYATGFEWLSRGWNFIHPAEIRSFNTYRDLSGYIPGGPTIYPDEKLYPRYGDNIDPFPHLARTAWVQGFVNGINEYVVQHGLDTLIGYPIIEPREYYPESRKLRTHWDKVKEILKEASGK